MWAFSASVGFILRPRLNGVMMALEGGGSGKVRVLVPRGKIDEKWEVEGQVEGQSGGTILKNWRDITLARAYRVRGGQRAKKKSKV